MVRSNARSVLVALVGALVLAALTAGAALAAGPPIVETKPATAVAGTVATLNGTVNPNEATTKYYFEYGPTSAYGSNTEESAILGSGVKEAHKAISSLSPLTTYHFRIVAKNGNGTSLGTDETFTTTSALPEFAVKAGQKLTEVEFTGSYGPSSFWVLGTLMTACNAGSFHGVLSGSKTLTGKAVFTGCRVGTRTCRSAGSSKSEEIVTEQLEGTLVYLSKAAKTVALNLKAKSGSLVIPLLCGNAKSEIRGSIVFPLTSPVNKLNTELYFGALNLNANNEQEITEYETEAGEKRHSVLESNFIIQAGFQPLGLSIGAYHAKTSKELELKA